MFEEKKLLFSKHYKVLQVLSETKSGTNSICLHIDTNEKVFVKIIDKIKILKSQNFQKLNTHLKFACSSTHPDINYVYEVLEGNKMFYIVQNYCENFDLNKFLYKNGPLNEKEAAKVLY